VVKGGDHACVTGDEATGGAEKNQELTAVKGGEVQEHYTPPE